MPFTCRKRLTHLLSALCVSLCFAAVLRDMWLNEFGIRTDSHIFRLGHFPSRLSFHALRGRKAANPSRWPRFKEPISNEKSNDLFPELKANRKAQVNNLLFKNLRGKQSIPQSAYREQKRHLSGLQEEKKFHDAHVNETDMGFLVEILRDKLAKVPKTDVKTRPTDNCNSSVTIGNSCDDSGCLQLKLPQPLDTRIQQIVVRDSMQLSAEYAAVLSAMAAEIPQYNDLIIVSAVSSNHYLESQAMMYNLHNNLFPHLKNYSFVYYNLGLKPAERRYLANICRCQMIDFPFHKFPDFVTRLKCYTWKPLIVNAVIQKANQVFWVDASIRFHADPTNSLALLRRSRERGIQMGWSKTTISKTTLQSMFHFFGDEACAYRPYNQGLSGVVIYHNEPLVRRAVLQPWAACALSDQCMCPQIGVDLYEVRISCHQDRGKYYYGLCHRFDQSALSILLTKLYQENIDHIILKDISQFVDIKRGDERPYEIPPEE